MIDSSSWTGRPTPPLVGRAVIQNWGIKGPKQLPLFMTWTEYWEDNEVIHATVKFNSRDLKHFWWWKSKAKRSLWRWQDRLRTLIKMVSGYDQSKCWVCQGDTYVYPSNLLKRAYCVEHCPEHSFEHVRGEGWNCEICGDPAPLDHHSYDYD